MNNRDLARFGASVTLSAMVTAGFPWVPVLLGWMLTAGIYGRFSPGTRPDMGREAPLVLLGALPVTAAILLGADGAFPEETTFPFVSLALLAVLLAAISSRRDSMVRVAGVLGALLLGILGTVAAFGLMDVRWERNVPELPAASQVCLSAAAGIPWWSGAENRRSNSWLAGAAAVSLCMSLVTRGVLGGALADWEGAPLYRAVQTVRILGVLQRLEALLAASVLMGAMILLLLTAEAALEAGEKLLGRSPGMGARIGFLFFTFLLEWGFRVLPEAYAGLVKTVFWGLLLTLTLGIVGCGKFAKKA